MYFGTWIVCRKSIQHRDGRLQETSPYLAILDQLYEHKLLERLKLDGGRNVCGRGDAYLEKLLRLLPPFESGEGDAARVVVDEVVVVGQI